MRLFSGNANLSLSNDVAKYLNTSLGSAIVSRFSDGEIMVKILENIRGKDIFIMQPTCTPCNENLMELVIMADACRRASAASITAVVPYFGYARQDRRIRSARVPISAKVVADILASVGFSRVITVDLHADQIQGFFDMPVDNIYASSLFYDDIKSKGNNEDLVVVSPDVGGVVRARAVAKQLGNIDLAIIDKRRCENKVEVMNLIGDVKDKHCILIDDMIDTAGTICQASEVLSARGARSITAYSTHPILSGNAIDNLEKSSLTSLVVTDTIPLSKKAIGSSKIKQISIAGLLAETIDRVSNKKSVSSLFPEAIIGD
jgi:ribose-phosphate pyrophosphokinase